MIANPADAEKWHHCADCGAEGLQDEADRLEVACRNCGILVPRDFEACPECLGELVLACVECGGAWVLWDEPPERRAH